MYGSGEMFSSFQLAFHKRFVDAAGWWEKPLAVAPLTYVECDGTFNTNIVTGGDDASADEIVAFVISLYRSR